MIPVLPEINESIVNEPLATKTFEITSENRLGGSIDDIDALKQAISIMLGVSRYEYIIHSWEFGMETNDLYGMPYDYVESELKRRIPEALLIDDRVISVEDMKFTYDRRKLLVSFTVKSIYGDVNDTLEVTI